MKSYIIFGVSGLLGLGLIKYIRANEDAQIIGVSRDRLDEKTFNFVGLNQIIYIQGDITDYNFVRRVINDYEANYIYNCASMAIVRICERHPLGAFNVNVMGSLNILEAARQNGTVKGIIQMSSDKAYGSIKQLPYKEEMILNPQGVYETTKASIDVASQMYGKNFDLPVLAIRSANLFGQADLNFSRLVPGTILRILNNQQPLLYSDVKDYIREFLFIKEACIILHKLIKKAKDYPGESVNLGSNSINRVEDFINRILKVMKREDLGIDIRDKEISFPEIPEQYLSLNKLKSIIGEHPFMTQKHLDECLRETISWYEEYKRL